MGKHTLLFNLEPQGGPGNRLCERLGIAPAPFEERMFDDGEIRVRPEIDVAGRDVVVLQSVFADQGATVHDRLCRLLFFIGAVTDAAAARTTAIVPYLAYARHDRRVRPGDPLTLRYVAALFEAVGTSGVVTVDVHNPAAFENAFRCPTSNLEATDRFVDHLVPQLGGKPVTVVSPDAGGLKRATRFRQALARTLRRDVAMAYLDKSRTGSDVTVSALAGPVKGRTVIIFDDLIATGSTMKAAATACREAGCDAVIAAATHGVFAGAGAAMCADPLFSRIVVTDTLAPDRRTDVPGDRLTVLETASLVAEALDRPSPFGGLR